MLFKKSVRVVEVYKTVNDKLNGIKNYIENGWVVMEQDFKTFELTEELKENGFETGRLYPYTIYEKEQ